MHRRGYLAFAAVMLLVQLGNERAPSRLSSPPNALAREPGQVLARLVNQGKRLGSSGAGRSGAVVSHPARSCHIRELQAARPSATARVRAGLWPRFARERGGPGVGGA